jgi:uncharacterized membrane protein YphA (DoxX/SURF4 family)
MATQSVNRYQNVVQTVFTLVRILIGWHFLYEGLAKLFSPWSSAGYLMGSQWLFSGVFHSIAENPGLLHVIDLLNIIGLIAVGICLLLGLFTRPASIVGTFLILLYYIANPPFIGYLSETTGEGHYLIVNKQLIEMAVLILFMFLPRSFFWSIDRLISSISGATGRAQFATLEDLKQKVPTGKIKGYEISRLICGGNLISGYAHSRDLIYVSQLVQSYFSDEKVLETFKLCEAVGINAMIVRVDNNTLRVLEKYRKRDGKMQWIAQCKVTDDDLKSDFDAAVANGAIGIYLHGGICDNYVRQDNLSQIMKSLEYMKKYDHLIHGLAAHDIRVVMESEKHGLEPDFFMKTLNSGNYWTAGPRLIEDPSWVPDTKKIVEPEYGADTNDNIWSVTPQQTVEYMNEVEKPWIAYKVLGAGAITPEEGFKYAFNSGADFTCVGMFDWQIVEDANIIADVLNGSLDRTRPWRG